VFELKSSSLLWMTVGLLAVMIQPVIAVAGETSPGDQVNLVGSVSNAATSSGTRLASNAPGVPEEDEQRKEKTEELKDQISEALPGDENKSLVKDLHKTVEKNRSNAMITNDAIIFGILCVMLGLIFWTSSIKTGFFGTFYKVVPMLLVCYFLPSLLTFFGVVDHHNSSLYFVATRYLLPATLILLTLSIDLKAIIGLGPKALIMFVTGTVGVILGGPLAVLIVSMVAPDIIGVDGPAAVWRGLSTVAGSWIGGGANQTAMRVVFMTPEDGATANVEEQLDKLYSVMVAVDVFVAEIWMMFLLLGVGKAKSIDRFFKADASSIDRLQEKMENFSLSVARVPTATDLMVIAALGFGGTAISHYMGGAISDYVNGMIEANSSLAFLKDLGLASSFFWLIVISTTIGIVLSFTKMRNYEGAGASKIGTVFIFMLVAVIGMGMDIRAVVKHPGFFVVGGIWMLFHVGLMFLMAWLIRAPYFFLAVGSKANIGGAASAPVVAAAFHPALAPVGVLLAVLGYALGTYGAMMCAWMMQFATPG